MTNKQIYLQSARLGVNIIMNIGELPHVIGMIFTHAFTPIAAMGGFAGAGVASAIRFGMARGLTSNDSGIGLAPIAHATATTDHPARQAMWGITEVFLDTIVICSCTAFAVLVSGAWVEDVGSADLGGTLATVAFSKSFGQFGGIFVTIALMLFCLSTLIMLIWYGEKETADLFGPAAAKVYLWVCTILIPFGAMAMASYLWRFVDFSLLFMLIPNVIACLLLRKDVAESTHEFFHTPGKYYMKDIGK